MLQFLFFFFFFFFFFFACMSDIATMPLPIVSVCSLPSRLLSVPLERCAS